MRIPRYKIITFREPRLRYCFVRFDTSRTGIKRNVYKKIIKLLKKYMKRYPSIDVKNISDEYNKEYWDTDVKQRSKVRYDENLKGEKYGGIYYDRNGAYYINEKQIVLNHKRLNKFNTGMRKLNKEAKKISNKINYEVGVIKQIEMLPFVERVLIHEFAHAIEFQVDAENDEVIKTLFELYNANNQFLDCHEFLAECFITSELLPNNQVAKIVRERIDLLVQGKNKKLGI